MGRLGTEADVVETVMFLASDESAYISGTVIPLDGGLAAPRGRSAVRDGLRILDADAHVDRAAGPVRRRGAAGRRA